MTRTVAAFVLGLLLGGTGIAIAADHGGQHSANRRLTIGYDTLMVFATLDLNCFYTISGPFNHPFESGPNLYCQRNSISTGHSRSVFIGPHHVYVTGPRGDNVAYKATRSP